MNPLCLQRVEGRKRKSKRKIKMKRILLISAAFIAMQTTFAQEKGLHLTLGGTAGKTAFACDLQEGSSLSGIGYSGTVGLQYFFNYHWGISLAGEYTLFNTQSRYNNKQFVFQNQIDDEGDLYNYYLHLQNWQENQQTCFVEIPLMLVYQYKFGKKEKAGVYFGLGVKYQMVLSSTFERYKGSIQTYGHYPEDNVWFGKEGESSTNYDHHAFGTNHFRTEEERSWNGNSGKNSLKAGFSAVAECGFLFSLSRRVDLSLGVAADYGLTNISSQNNPLVNVKEGTIQQNGNYVAENVTYNGVLNSGEASKINPYSLRGKIGIRIKLGRVKEMPEAETAEDEDEDEPSSQLAAKGRPDTIYVYPVVVYLPPSDTMPRYVSGGSGNRAGELYSPQAPSKVYLPAVEMPISWRDATEELEESIYFDLDKYALNAQAKAVLDRKVELMRRYPQAVITIIGRTCDKGNKEYNDRLSNDRAEAARVYMIKSGINADRIILKPMGMSNPTYANSSEHNRELNRRVDFIIAK